MPQNLHCPIAHPQNKRPTNKGDKKGWVKTDKMKHFSALHTAAEQISTPHWDLPEKAENMHRFQQYPRSYWARVKSLRFLPATCFWLIENRMRKITPYFFAAMISSGGAFFGNPKNFQTVWMVWPRKRMCLTPLLFLSKFSCGFSNRHLFSTRNPRRNLHDTSLSALAPAVSWYPCTFSEDIWVMLLYKGCKFSVSLGWWCTPSIYAAYEWIVGSLSNSGFTENVIRNWFHMVNYIICSIFKTCI